MSLHSPARAAGASAAAVAAPDRRTAATRPRHAKNGVVWGLMIASLVGLSVAIPARHRVVNARPSVSSRVGASRLPVPARAAVSRVLGRDDPALRAVTHADGIALVNRRHRLSARFGMHGVQIAAGATRLRLGLAAVGFGDELATVEPVRPRARANRVEYARGSLREWYVNGPAGLEQGFTLARAPSGQAAGPLTLALSTASSARLDRDRRGAVFTSSDGHDTLAYRGLWAADARGRELRAWLETRGEQMLVRVDARHATYPLTIDPIMQGAKLTSFAGGGLNAGVAIDGNTIVTSGPDGSLYVFVEPSAGWIDATETAKLGSGFGSSVAISGNTIVAGVPGRPGAVDVFVKPATGWVDALPNAVLTASPGSADGMLGTSVAISGNTIVAGAPNHRDWSLQSAYVFVRPAGGWADATETAKLTATDNIPYGGFGESVAILGDTIAVGAQSSFNGSTVYVFVRPTNGWADATQAARLTPSDPAVAGGFGASVALGADTLVTGVPSYNQVGGNGGQGAAYVFAKPATGWVDAKQTARLTASDGAADDLLGSSVSIVGSRVAVGAPGDDVGAHADQGSLYVFARPGGGWTNSTEVVKLTASDGPAGGLFGTSVAQSGDTILGGPLAYQFYNVVTAPAYLFNYVASAPAPPSLTGTVPGSPSSDNAPRVVGTAEEHSTIRVYRTFDCSGPPAAQGDASVLGSTGLVVPVPADSVSSLRATTTDWAGVVSVCSAALTYVEDSLAPETSVVSGPVGPTDDPAPSFGFSSTDPDAVFECRLDDGAFAACGSPLTTGVLAEGEHVFRVRAIDRAHNVDATPAVRSFAVDTSAPVARLEVSPGPALTGESVRFDASGSSDPPAGTITRYEWDLDGDGTYETDSGSSASVSRSYAAAGDLTAAVRLTDDFGRSSEARVGLSVRPVPPRGRVGVTINAGDVYTNEPNVVLDVVWPQRAKSMLISNDGGFRNARRVAVNKTVRWRLAFSRRERQQNLVYVRFDEDTKTFSDNIILDQVAPKIHAASIASTPAGTQLKLRADDNRSGVQSAQIRYDRQQQAKTVPYQARLKLTGHPSSVQVRVQDRAGNYSRWRTATAQARYNHQTGR